MVADSEADSTGTPSHTVLVVDDEEPFTELCAAWLDDYDVVQANSGREALAAVTDATDVVLLDRRMPGLSGPAVLAEMRGRGVDAAVAVVSAVRPGSDVLEMELDAYLRKPVTRADVRGAVERLVARTACDDRVREYLAAESKRVVLERATDGDALAASEPYRRLSDRCAELRSALERSPDGPDAADLDRLRVETGGEPSGRLDR